MYNRFYFSIVPVLFSVLGSVYGESSYHSPSEPALHDGHFQEPLIDIHENGVKNVAIIGKLF